MVRLYWTDPADDDLESIVITWKGGISGTDGDNNTLIAPKSTAPDRSNSRIVINLINRTTYTFTVKAVDSSGNQSQVATATATTLSGTDDLLSPPDTTPPGSVSGLTAASGSGQVTLTWTDPADADLGSLVITWTAGTGGSVTAPKSTAPDRGNSITITGLTGGTAYTFTVKAADPFGNQSQAATVTATPAGIAGTVFTITDTTEWNNALAQISASSGGTSLSPKEYTLVIQGAVSVQNVSNTPSITGDHKTVRLTGSGTLFNGCIFRTSSNQTLIIDGPTLNGSAFSLTRVVHIEGGTVELLNGIIAGSNSPYSTIPDASTSGGVYVGSSGTFIMSGGTISGYSSYYGGGVYVADSGTFIMSGGTISGNSTYSENGTGGGVYVAGNGTFTMQGGTISGNSARSSGGVYIGGTFTMSGGTISGNTAYNSGGGIYVDGDGTFAMSGGTISDNTGSTGGGVFFSGEIFAMSGGIISGNTANGRNTSGAYGSGGGVDISYGTFTMSGSAKISNNTANAYGGGVFVPEYTTFTMEDSAEISGNTASYSGGGVFVNGTCNIKDGIINNNTSSGVYVADKGIFTIEGGTISGNKAFRGGGVYVTGTFTKTGGTIYGDTDHIFDNSEETDNTATSSSNLGKNGHAVLYYAGSGNYYRNETLLDDDDISTTDTLPAESGQTLNNWTRY